MCLFKKKERTLKVYKIIFKFNNNQYAAFCQAENSKAAKSLIKNHSAFAKGDIKFLSNTIYSEKDGPTVISVCKYQ